MGGGVISGGRGGQGVGPSLPMLHPKTDEHLNPSVEVHHLVGKLSTAETLLNEVQRTVPTCPGSFLVINVCNQGKTSYSPCMSGCSVYCQCVN